MADLNLLERLCTAQGISGDEGAVRELILKEITPFAKSVTVTPLGNLIVEKEGAARAKTRVLLNAHMDEVGLIVTGINENGLLRFSTVGGIDRRILPGKSVLVAGTVPGVIGAKPIHLLDGDEKEKAPALDSLTIDIGASSKEEAETLISPGDSVTFVSLFDASHGRIRSRAIDDRAGCAILIDLMKKDLPYDCTFVFAVQEEVGLRGSKTAAFAAEPEAAIVVESTTAADIPGVEPEKQVCHVGKGPVLSFMDRATIYDREYFALAKKLAAEKGIPCQVKEAVAGGNDAGAIHVSRGGVRTAAVSLACRYLHSPVGMIAEEDFHHAEELIEAMAMTIAGGETL